MRYCFFVLILCLAAIGLYAQESSYRTIYFSGDLAQYKDSENYGLVFTGPGLTGGCKWGKETDLYSQSYDFDLGLAVLLSKNMLTQIFMQSLSN